MSILVLTAPLSASKPERRMRHARFNFGCSSSSNIKTEAQMIQPHTKARIVKKALIKMGGVLALLIWCSSLVWAQGVTTGSIAGTVTDQTGGVVPGARIKLRDEGTNVVKEMVANDSGGFVIPNLPFGAYEITVSSQGFQTSVHKGVVVESARTTDLTVRMKVGDVVDTVQVQGDAPVLELTSSTISNTVRNEEIRNLPLGGRTILNFALLVP